MDTLQVKVQEVIRVSDVVEFIEKIVIGLFNFFMGRRVNTDEILVSQNLSDGDETRGPPTLGVNVNETIKTGDYFGRH